MTPTRPLTIEDTDDAIDFMIHWAMKTNRIPQKFDMTTQARKRLVGTVHNLIEHGESNDYIFGLMTGWILGYGHLLNVVAGMVDI
jgi:hypothetical protein